MSSQGPLTPTVDPESDAQSGVEAWAAPENAKTQDGAVAEVVCIGDDSQLLSSRSFGFTIPVGATITGIRVRAKIAILGGTPDIFASLRKTTGVPSASRLQFTGPFTDILTFYSVGGDGSMFGEAWTRADINSAQFGNFLQVSDAGGGTQADIDVTDITVFYTTPQLSAQQLPLTGGS